MAIMIEQVDYSDLMTQFRKAYAAVDSQLLGGVLGEGFEWHTHTFDPGNPNTTGRVLYGIEEMVEQLEWRRANWIDVRFEDLIEHFAPKLITQSFTISGADRGTPFHVAAIDLYTLNAADMIIKKDTYWKHSAS
jgi:hypothetical protein